ncbi:MAG TPA: transporter substrate-binding domain-containing protein [Candidatus Gemmiger faecavium]|nr:transporter substrate-binding domain-containing protein [Candidatus Gemmiger faecavium]
MKRIVSTVLAAALVLSLAACSNGDAGTSAADDSSEAVTAETSSDAAGDTDAEESDLAYIQEKGTLIIGYTVYAPMNYTDDEGNFTGFDTELATAVCEKLGVTPEFQEINWETKVIELDAGTIDCIWNGMTLTEDIMENTACTEAYAKNAQVIVMNKDAEYTGTADLVSASIAYEAGSAGQETIEAEENLSQADLVPMATQADCLPEVKAGSCQAAVLDLTLANAMIGEGTSYTDLEIKDELNVEEYGVAFRKGSDVADAVNEAFAALREDGTMQALADKYNLELAD